MIGDHFLVRGQRLLGLAKFLLEDRHIHKPFDSKVTAIGERRQALKEIQSLLGLAFFQ